MKLHQKCLPEIQIYIRRKRDKNEPEKERKRKEEKQEITKEKNDQEHLQLPLARNSFQEYATFKKKKPV